MAIYSSSSTARSPASLTLVTYAPIVHDMIADRRFLRLRKMCQLHGVRRCSGKVPIEYAASVMQPVVLRTINSCHSGRTEGVPCPPNTVCLKKLQRQKENGFKHKVLGERIRPTPAKPNATVRSGKDALKGAILS